MNFDTISLQSSEKDISRKYLSLPLRVCDICVCVRARARVSEKERKKEREIDIWIDR